MAKFSITKLEDARHNPQQFAKSLAEADDKKKIFPKSQFMDWQRAAIVYHERSDLNTAIQKLTTAFQMNYVESVANDRKLEDYVLKLQNYTYDAEKKGMVLSEKYKNIRIVINGDLQMTGRIPIIYLNDKGGYAACFFQKQTSDWQQQLKYPIIQHHIATSLYGCDTKLVEVGIYNLADSTFEMKCFSKKVISDAREELNDLGDTIVSYL